MLSFYMVVLSSGLLLGQVRELLDPSLRNFDDRYYDEIIKGLTRFNRDTSACRVDYLTLDTPIQSK